MQTKYTAGPWQLSLGKDIVGKLAPNGSLDVIADCKNSVPQGAERLANAQLIACSPEVLRELKACICYIETYGGEVTRSYAAGGNLTQVKALIARAESQS